MLLIQKLKHPNKRSGFALEPGKRTEMRGLLVVNQTGHTVYVDKWTRKKCKKKK